MRRPKDEISEERRLLSPEQLAEFVGVPLGTVYQWHARGGGPLRIRVGRHIRYRQSDVDRWLESRTEGQPA